MSIISNISDSFKDTTNSELLIGTLLDIRYAKDEARLIITVIGKDPRDNDAVKQHTFELRNVAFNLRKV